MAAFRGGISCISLIINRNPNPKFILPCQLITTRDFVTKLFVGGLSFYTTEESLSEAFSQFGQVIEAKIVIDKVSDRSKGFGFVTFASLEEAGRAVTDMNGKILNGRTVFVDYAKANSSQGDNHSIARPPPQPLTGK